MDARAGERTARAFRNDHGVGSFSRPCHGVRRERAAQRNLRWDLSLDPSEISRRARIGARNPFVSNGIPTADLGFYPAAPVVPFQGNTGSEIGLAGGLGSGLDEDDGCGVGAAPGGWNS